MWCDKLLRRELRSLWISVNHQNGIQNVDKDGEGKLSAASEADPGGTFLCGVCGGTVRSLSACFGIMELCHILFKVRLIWGDSEPLIYCHNTDVFMLCVTMALLCVGLPRARCTRA